MWLPDAGERRRILRREVLRRCRFSLAGVAVLTVAGLLFLVVGLRGERGQPTPMDVYLKVWLVAVAVALVLALTQGEVSLRRLLTRLPTTAADELRVRMEVGLGCGVLVLASLFLVEICFHPTLLRPTFRSQLNKFEARTFQNLPGIPLLRFTADGRVSRGLVHDFTLWTLWAGDPDFLALEPDFPLMFSEKLSGPLQPGQTLIRIGRESWNELRSYNRTSLKRLGWAAGTEVVLERYVGRSEYLSGRWRRDGLYRSRAWPFLDRVVCFLFPLGMFIALSTIWGDKHLLKRFGYGHFEVLSTCAFLVFLSYILELLPRWPIFRDASPRQGIWVPVHLEPYGYLLQLALPAAVAVVSVLSLRWSYQVLRFIRAETDSSQIGAEPVGKLARWGYMLFYIYLLKTFLTSFEPTDGELPGIHPSGYVKIVVTVFWFAWSVTLVGAAWIPIHLARRWARRDRLLSRLPADPGAVAWKRLRLLAKRLAALCVIPLLLELVMERWWTSASAAHVDFLLLLTRQADLFSRLTFSGFLVLALGALILVLALRRSVVASVAGAIGLPSWAFVLVSVGSRAVVFLTLVAVSAVGFTAAYLQLRRNITWGGSRPP